MGGYAVIWGEGVCGWLRSDMGGGSLRVAGEESAGGYTVIWGEGVCGWLRSDMGGGSLRVVTQ